MYLTRNRNASKNRTCGFEKGQKFFDKFVLNKSEKSI